MKTKLMLGAVEAGGTKFVCAIGDIKDGKPIIYERAEFKTSEDPIGTLKTVTDWFSLQQEKKCKRLSGIGIASFGPICLDINSEQYGSILLTPKENWSNFNIINEFRKIFPDTKFFIDTDVNGSALGEFYFGAAKGLSNFIYITIGTGIGAGGMVNGKLIHGLIHAEMGHMKITKIDGDTFKGVCSYHGDCWEGLCSGPAIYARTNTKAENLPISDEAWELESEYTAMAISNIIYCFSPEKIIIGGGISKGGLSGTEPFFRKIRSKVISTLKNYITAKELTEEYINDYIIPPALGDNSGIYGALMLATKTYSSDFLAPEDSRKRIEKEDDLINHRMSWCVGSNSFLLAALMVASNNSKPNIVSGMVKGFIPYAGLTLSICFIISILAAYFAIWNWRENCEISRSKFTFSPTSIAISGSIASILSPTIFISIWIVLIRAQHYIFQSEFCSKFTEDIQAVPYILSGILISFSIVIFALFLWISLFFDKESQFYICRSLGINKATLITNHKYFLLSELVLYTTYSLSLCVDTGLTNTISKTSSLIGASFSLIYALVCLILCKINCAPTMLNINSVKSTKLILMNKFQLASPFVMFILWALFFFYVIYLIPLENPQMDNTYFQYCVF